MNQTPTWNSQILFQIRRVTGEQDTEEFPANSPKRLSLLEIRVSGVLHQVWILFFVFCRLHLALDFLVVLDGLLYLLLFLFLGLLT